ncbi:MAG: hypothetical protein HY033_12785 [Ignavibacteriae bacterium]|nr:hypothetical protein [Ignavibacteria bacterium]MBI3365769.1 hypothetical protein [Ignavibacteriota bacterium]
MVAGLSKRRWTRSIWSGLFVVVCSLTTATSGVKVSPVQLLVVAPSRSAALRVHNPSDKEEREMWMEVKYGYQTTDEKGAPHVVIVPADSGGAKSAARWIRAYPERFVLQPNATQIVRVVASAPPDLPDGEYWARIVVSSKPLGARRIKDAGASPLPRGGFITIEKADLPFHYRKGKLTSGLVLRNVNTTPGKDSMRVAVDLQRIGNTSYWGTLTCRLRDHSGNVVSVYKKNLVVYQDETYVYSLRTANVPAGEYTFELNFSNKEGSDMVRQYAAESEAVNYSTKINLQ